MTMPEIKKEKALGGFPPTEEQLLIRDHYVKGDNIMVDAGAGSSKTSTSVYLSQQDERSVLYLAYNKAIATEAEKQFPRNVTVKTFHALAYAFVGHKYRDKLQRPSGQYVNVAMTVSEIQKYYRVGTMAGCNELRICSLIKDIISRFEYSADTEISLKHVPQKKIEEFVRMNSSGKELNVDKLKEVAVNYAKRLWNDRIDLSSPVMCTHDTYLKLYQLSNPKLRYDCIIGDEFQDVNPVVADIILKQTCQKVLIGDPNQSIYGWRGAKNFLKENFDYTTLYLSKSFRYGQVIADLAMMVINYKRELQGFEKKDSKVGFVDTSGKYTKIFRTNACLLIEAAQLITEGVQVSFDINCKDFINKIYNVIYLRNGEKSRVKHKDIILFDNYDEFVEEAEYDPELKRVKNIIESNDSSSIIDALKSYRKPRNPDVIFTTGHKSKGLQWDNVILADDFPTPVDEKGEYKELSQGEVNLLYVCLTRAQELLQINRSIFEIKKQRKIDKEVSERFKSVVGNEVNILQNDLEF